MTSRQDPFLELEPREATRQGERLVAHEHAVQEDEQGQGAAALEHDALLQWANPGLPDPHPDPYRRGLSAAELAACAR